MTLSTECREYDSAGAVSLLTGEDVDDGTDDDLEVVLG